MIRGHRVRLVIIMCTSGTGGHPALPAQCPVLHALIEHASEPVGMHKPRAGYHACIVNMSN